MEHRMIPEVDFSAVNPVQSIIAAQSQIRISVVNSCQSCNLAVLEAAPTAERESPGSTVNTSPVNVDTGAGVTTADSLDVAKTHVVRCG